jgi:aryl-alcohol dehydrogenase-like predicted oxidoreductase
VFRCNDIWTRLGFYVIRALDDLIRSGKILYVGISDTPAWIVSQANSIADLRSWSPFIGIQIMYSLIERTPERELLPMAHALDIGVTAWSPLGAGVLSGKYNKQAVSNDDKGKQQNRLDVVGNPMTAIFLNERNFSIAKEVQEIAREIDRTASQVALNWIRQQNKQNKGVIIPIIGAKTEAQITDNLGCLDFELTPDQLKRLDDKTKIQLGFPHDFMSEDNLTFLFGKSFSLIDNHRATSL